MRSRGSINWRVPVAMTAGALALLADNSRAEQAAPEVSTAPTLGFVVRYFEVARSPDPKADCPTGYNKGPDVEAVLARFPEAERQRLRDSENLKFRAVARRGPSGPNICLHPTAEPDPGHLVGQSKTQLGLNLMAEGGMPSALACGDAQIVSPETGENVQNQFTRVDACAPAFQRFYSGNGDTDSRLIVQGSQTILIEVRGVRDLKDSPDVTVGIYAGDEPAVVDHAGRVLSDATYQPVDDEKFQAVVRGQIKDGVLITDFTDLRLLIDHSISQLDRSRHEVDWKSARLRLKFNPDGTLSGLLGGYTDWQLMYRLKTRGGTQSLNNAMGVVGEVVAQYQCSGYYNALQRMADGYRDPQTGQCTRISTAYELKAVPAFIRHKDGQPTMIVARDRRVDGE